MYEAFVAECKKVYQADKVQTGIFGSTCEIALINDVSASNSPMNGHCRVSRVYRAYRNQTCVDVVIST